MYSKCYMYQFLFRSNHQFIHDVTDAYIIPAFMDNMDFDEITSEPVNRSLFSLMDEKAKSDWIADAASNVLKTLGLDSWAGVLELRQVVMICVHLHIYIYKLACIKNSFGKLVI